MSYSVADRVREMCAEIVEGRGLPVDDGYLDYLTDLADVLPIATVMGQIGRDDYEAFRAEQEVETRVEALSDR